MISTETDLFFDQLRDLLSVETQLISALPELIAFATDPLVKSHLRQHLEETRRQKEDIEAIFRNHGEEGGGDACKAMQGLIEGGRNHLHQVKGEALRDLLLTAHCSRIEAYEIAAYQFTLSIARRLGLQPEAQILQRSLKEEQRMAEAIHRIEETESAFGGDAAGS